MAVMRHHPLYMSLLIWEFLELHHDLLVERLRLVYDTWHVPPSDPHSFSLPLLFTWQLDDVA